MELFNTAVRILVMSVLAAIAGHAPAQQAYPSKSIRIIVPYPPGGSNNVLARLIGQKLNESWGQQVIVDNRPGGNTIIGSEALLKSAPDRATPTVQPSMQAQRRGPSRRTAWRRFRRLDFSPLVPAACSPSRR